MASSGAASIADQHGFAPWIRWAAGVWLIVWVPAYWYAWGPANFLHLCDLAVFLTCIGVWTDNALLISSQAVGSLLVDLAWALDAAWYLVVHHHLIGGTEYLFDAHIALWIRLLSLFHVFLPPLLLWGARSNRLRPARVGIAVGNCGGRIRREPVYESGGKHQLRFHRSFLASQDRACPGARRAEHSFHGRRCVLTNAPRSGTRVCGVARGSVCVSGLNFAAPPFRAASWHGQQKDSELKPSATKPKARRIENPARLSGFIVS